MIEILNGTHETVKHREGLGLKFYDNVQNEEYPSHWHTEIEIVMPIVGPYVVEAGGTVYNIDVGDIIIINSGVVHHLYPPIENGRRYIFQSSFGILHNVYGMESVLTMLPPALLLNKEKDPDIYNSIKESIFEIHEEYVLDVTLSEAAIYSLLIEMFVIIGRKYSSRADFFEVNNAKKKEYSEKFTSICDYINEHFAEDLTLEDVAGKAGFSKYHFTRLFKQFTGYSFYKYLNHKRIECAEKLLIDPDISITEVAIQSGFSSLSSFIRMFKQLKECTPTEFRNMYRY